nr:immunoglobulin heavy chain junction region [Homo sapiens]
SLRSEDTAVYY